MSNLDDSYAQPEGPDFDVFVLIVISILTFVFICVFIEKAFSEPAPCVVHRHEEVNLIPQIKTPKHIHYITKDEANRNKGNCEVYKDLAGGFNVICGKPIQLDWISDE